MISVLIPYIRKDRIKRLIEEIKENAGIEGIEILSYYDEERQGCPKSLHKLVICSKFDYVCFIGDDCRPQKDFLKNAYNKMQTLKDGWGVVGLNSQKSEHAAHFLAHKKMLDLLEDRQFFNFEYKHSFCDRELTDIATEKNRYIFAEDSIIIHENPVFDKKWDDIDYSRIYDNKIFMHDFKLYLKRKKDRLKFKLGIGIPIINAQININFFTSFITLNKPDYTLFLPKNEIGGFIRDIALIRNDLVKQAMLAGCSHLLMMDTDQIYRDENMIYKMLDLNVDVVGSLIYRRYPPFDAILLRGDIGKYNHVKDEELEDKKIIEVDAVGTGCVLYNMDIFFNLDNPWFELGETEDKKPIGEDIMLCSKIRKAGYKIIVNLDSEIGHLTTFEINKETNDFYKKLTNYKFREV